MAARFFIDAPLVSGTDIELPAEVAHHAARVLRLRDGAPVVLFNGRGGEFAATLSVGSGKTRVRVREHNPIERESPLAVTLLQAWIATDKLDWLVEKAVELGVASIVLAPAQRSVVRLTQARSNARLERLRSVAVTACAQCGRNRIPAIESSSTLGEALSIGLRDRATAVLLHPRASSGLREVRPASGLSIAVGPEGGFDDDEMALALREGYVACHLGRRVLRTETAGLAALAALQALYGDLG